MNILVTGGSGYIGSHTAVELINKGHHPILIDNLSNSHEEVVKYIEQITGKAVDFFNVDLCDRTAVFNLLKTLQVNAVIHFAAFKSVSESVLDPLKYYRNNIDSLINLLDALVTHKINRLVFSSSCTVYGEASLMPVRETDPFGPASSPYGATKQIGEQLIKDATAAYGLNSICLRYFNPAGAHSSALIGEYPLQSPTNLVPVITRNAIKKSNKLTVFGTDYHTPDGTCIRDYIHVVDLAKAHVCAIERMFSDKVRSMHEVFNVGTGKGHSVLDVIHAFRRSTTMELEYTIGPRRPGDIEQIWAATGLTEQELNWKAQCSLDEIVSSAWKWEQQLQQQLIKKADAS